ncbi:GDP-fucose synthetase [Candidatus Vecturithrix granuli]|uniref:GDP-L-fucose synthase n=1 Tax=Vecturithrix granuli TaxID=1499967 RepID=A0A081BW82_VECG1|nr:GDP-fucose synthetase [Candidatus Vecturithrix granuli]
MEKQAKIYITGHRGLVGSAVLRALQQQGFHNLVMRTSQELDLRIQADVDRFFEQEQPDYVFVVAGKVGGIMANSTYPAEFIYDNVMIAANVIHASYKCKVKKLLFTGSSCIYPKFARQPIKEDYLLDGKLEPTNDAYAIAKIAGIKMCQAYHRQYGVNFISAMPTNLYGINDNFDLQSSHVLPALIRKFHDAKQGNAPEVVLWGTGRPLREFLFVDDLADALLFLMEHYNDPEIINVGVGKEISIREVAELIRDIVGFQGKLVFDATKPDGTPRKLLDVSKIQQLGWQAKTPLVDGIRKTYAWFEATHRG